MEFLIMSTKINIRKLFGWMHEPCDGRSLGVFRILFGIMMLFDILSERGMHRVERTYGDENQCQFPLFSFVQPLPLHWMYIVFLCMFLGAAGITFGEDFHISCFTYAVTYWYDFLLNTTVWNNHSYLYGLISLLLLATDSHHCYSTDANSFNSKLICSRCSDKLTVDAETNSPPSTQQDINKRRGMVPRWNYLILKAQIVMVYFFAGVKKTESDWVAGYSMTRLSEKWVFYPLRLFLPPWFIDLVVVHWSGFILDAFGGFGLLYPRTRNISACFLTLFHCLNSRMFHIGMFPYVMLCSTLLFFPYDWPQRVRMNFTSTWERLKMKLITKIVTCNWIAVDSGDDKKKVASTNAKIANPKTHKTANDKSVKSKVGDIDQLEIGVREYLVCLGVGLYLAWQCFMPFSHFITKGYNGWTQGIYGYSWDMMIHTWGEQHRRLFYVDRDTGNVQHLDPYYFSEPYRWGRNPDTVKQLALCVRDYLERDAGITNITLHFDVWVSLNKRYQQRMFDPTVDLITAPWHPFKPTPWLKPLLIDYSSQRADLKALSDEVMENSPYEDVIFVADFPGLVLDNYLDPAYINVTVTLINGSVLVVTSRGNISLTQPDDKAEIPSGEFHHVMVTSDTPATYYYKYFDINFARQEELGRWINDSSIERKFITEEDILQYKNETSNMTSNNETSRTNDTISEYTRDIVGGMVAKAYQKIWKSMFMILKSLEAIMTGENMTTIFGLQSGREFITADVINDKYFAGLENASLPRNKTNVTTST